MAWQVKGRQHVVIMKETEELSGSTASGLARTTEEPSRRCLKLVKVLEVVILVSILVIVWGIFVVVPLTLYGLPPLMANTAEDTGCLKQTIYEGTICSDELKQWQLCFSSQQQADVVYVPSGIDQSRAESMANLLVGALRLPFLSASPECTAAIKPFMCLYLFGSCDSDNQLRQVSQTDCVRLRDDVCAGPWERISMFQEGALPDCRDFGDQDIQCSDTNGTLFTNSSEDVKSVPISPTVECEEGFYFDNESMLCRHLCISWVDPLGTDPDTVVVIASLVNAVVTSAIVIIVTLTLLRKEMLQFPKYYLIYLCLTTVVIALVVLIGVADKRELFCSSRSLVDSFISASFYCTFNGVVYHYGVIQIGVWTLFFTLAFFWGIFFPFNYQKFKSTKRLKYIHAATVLLGLFLPIIPVVVQIKDGYQLSEAPRRAICTGKNISATFFGFLLPFSVLSAIITSLLVLIFWKILKELAIKKLLREAKPNIVGRAEAKILSVICYYILTSCLIIITFMYALVSRERSEQIIENYLTCQSTGLQPGKECGETPDVQLGVLNSLGTTSVFFQSFVPVVVLMFISKCTRSWNSKWTNSRRVTSHSRSRTSNSTR